jgi:hypothetical protein
MTAWALGWIFPSRSTITLASTLVCIASLHAQPTLQITSPANGAVFRPGQTITVSVTGSGIASVFIAGEGPLGYTAPVSGPPFQFSVPIPATITPKQYTLTAIGLGASGQKGASAQITIAIQRSDSPVSLHVQPSVLRLNVGQAGYLRVSGTYSDGTVAYLTQAASTTFVSSAPAIATVNNYGAVTAVSSGSTTITVNGTVQVPVTVAPALKVAPRQKALYAGQSQQFFPTLANASVPSVSWMLNPQGVGSVSSSGIYTAPSSITSQQTVLLTATDASNDTATATITLLPALAMSVTPSSVSLSASQTAQFSTAFSNTVNSRVNWSLTPAIGEISPLGFYTAPPSITSPQTVILKATSTVDGTTAATAAINLLSPPYATVTTASNLSAFYPVNATSAVPLSATVTSTGGTVGTGTVTFTVLQGTTVIGSPLTSGTVTAGVAYATLALPIGMASGSYTIQVVYNPGTGFVTSSDSTHMLTLSRVPQPTTLYGSDAGFSGPASALQWTFSIGNSASVVANAAQITGFSLDQASGPICTPVIPSLPLSIGNIAPGTTVPVSVVIDFSSCVFSPTLRFTLFVVFSANAGAANGFIQRNNERPL